MGLFDKLKKQPKKENSGPTVRDAIENGDITLEQLAVDHYLPHIGNKVADPEIGGKLKESLGFETDEEVKGILLVKTLRRDIGVIEKDNKEVISILVDHLGLSPEAASKIIDKTNQF